MLAAAIALATGSLIPTAASTAAADTPSALPALGGAAAKGKATTITLVTGDTVTVTEGADGRSSAAAAPGPGRRASFVTYTDTDGDLHVYPTDVLDAVAAKTVDDRLFDVTRLIKDGAADSRTATVPVIVAYSDKASGATLGKRADRLPGGRRGPVLARSDMAAVHVDKHKAASFWKSVGPDVAARAAKKGKKTAAAPAAVAPDSVAKVWYDAPVKAALDKSVPQIHAPEAWAQGYDGKGVKVAILDTGIDLGHPDVKDRVVGTKSFVPGVTSVQDGHGHGTHVASTIAGSGAASGGKYKGVAPEADLLIGKVLSDAGTGADSDVIAGMEWAVAEHADVVSMSLGDDAGTYDDPSSQAVDRLSASTGTLFVVAAGNTGPAASSIGSPGAAAAALTVGAVDRSDTMADFSSRGPTRGNGALKPDITAPGVDIVAARAAGTTMGTPVDANYTAASGTSMATPHVAGAAAILAQRHPDWTGEQIKAALTSHAVPTGGTSVHAQGNGRVDVAASLGDGIDLSGSVSFGTIAWQSDYQPVTRTVTLRNPSDAATTVSLSAAMDDALPATGVTFPQPKVDLPAHGTAEVPVALDATGVPSGFHQGRIVATAANGSTAHAAVAFTAEPRMYNLTVHFKGRDGAAAESYFALMGLDASYSQWNVTNDTKTIRVPRGTYAAFGIVSSDHDFHDLSYGANDTFSVPDIDLENSDAEITVDANRAHDIRLNVTDEKRPLTNSNFTTSSNRTAADGRTMNMSYTVDTSATGQRLGAIPSVKPATGTADTTFAIRQTEPEMRAAVTGKDGFALPAYTFSAFDGTTPDSSVLPSFTGTRTLRVVDAGTATADQLASMDLRGKAVLLRSTYTVYGTAYLDALKKSGAGALIGAPTRDRATAVLGLNSDIPYFATDYRSGLRLAGLVASRGARPVTVALHGRADPRYAYEGQWTYRSTIPANLDINVRKRDFATIDNAFHSDVTDGSVGYTNDLWTPGTASAVRLIEPQHTGHSRADHVYAPPGQMSRTVLWMADAVELMGPERAVRAGHTVTDKWLSAASNLSGDVAIFPCNFCLTNAGPAILPMISDSESDHYSDQIAQGMELYRNGERVDDYTFVKDKADYRLVFDASWDPDLGVRLGVTTHTDLAFTTAGPTAMKVKGCDELMPAGTITACETLPVILPHYDMPVDLHNTAPAGRDFSFTLDALRAKGFDGPTEVSGAAVSVSYDNGATWVKAEVRRKDGDSFTVRYRHPALAATDGYVTVKAEVWDGHGSRTVQTVDHAYALKG